jgi:hypothetical protein
MDSLWESPLEGEASDHTGNNYPTDHRPEELSAHPDLLALGRRLRLEMDETLRAEQYAARVSAQRRSTLRDRFLMAEDRGAELNVEVVDGSDICGTVVAVGVDHVVVADRGQQCWVALHHVIAVRIPIS